jgi:hypothetical protein
MEILFKQHYPGNPPDGNRLAMAGVLGWRVGLRLVELRNNQQLSYK